MTAVGIVVLMVLTKVDLHISKMLILKKMILTIITHRKQQGRDDYSHGQEGGPTADGQRGVWKK